MAGLVPAISIVEAPCPPDLDRRVKPGDDIRSYVDLSEHATVSSTRFDIQSPAPIDGGTPHDLEEISMEFQKVDIVSGQNIGERHLGRVARLTVGFTPSFPSPCGRRRA